MTDNRRRDPRHNVQITAEVAFGERCVPGETRNISASGVNVVVDEELPDGGQVSLTLLRTVSGIEDPEFVPLELPASVMWCAPSDAGGFTAGLRFGELTTDQLVVLSGLIERVTVPPGAR